MKNLLLLLILVLSLSLTSTVNVFAQQDSVTENNSLGPNTNSTVMEMNGDSQIIVEIRGIDSLTLPDLIALLSTDNEVIVQKVDVNSSQVMPDQTNMVDPMRMIEIPMRLNTPVTEGSEIKACVIELAEDHFNSMISCSIDYVNPGSSNTPQKIIVTT